MSGGCSSASAAGHAVAATRVEALRSDALERLVPEWEALATQAAEPNPLYEPWMLRPALEAYAQAASVRVVTVRLDGQLCGVFPLDRTRYAGLPVRALRSWRHRHCVLGTPLVQARRAAQCVAALLDWAAGEGIAVLDFDYVAGDGPFHAALLNALAERELPSFTRDGFARPLLRRAANAEAFLAASLTPSYRKKLARLQEKLAQRGELRHVALGAGDDFEAWLESFLRLEASGWKGANGSALGCREEDRRFVAEIFRSAWQRGRFIGVGLDLDGKPIARICGFTGGEGSFGFKTAYDESWAKFAPGILVELDWIRKVHELPGIAWSDSYTTPDNEVMKRLWKDARTIQRVAIGLTLPGRLAVSLLPLLRTLKKEAQSAVSKGAWLWNHRLRDA